jgi:hypothetical protein
MTGTPSATRNATTAKPNASPFGEPKNEMAKMKMSADFREMTEKGLTHAGVAYARATSSTSFPRRIGSFGRLLRRSQPRLPNQPRRAYPRRSIGLPDQKSFRRYERTMTMFRNSPEF